MALAVACAALIFLLVYVASRWSYIQCPYCRSSTSFQGAWKGRWACSCAKKLARIEGVLLKDELKED